MNTNAHHIAHAERKRVRQRQCTNHKRLQQRAVQRKFNIAMAQAQNANAYDSAHANEEFMTMT